MTLELRIRPLAATDVDEVATAADVDRGTLLAEVTSWQQQKAPTVVARTLDGAFVGFARARPNEVETGPRTEGQVAELTHLFVAAERRGHGAGTALVERALKTLRMLGFARVVAAVTEPTAAWLAARDWQVLPANRALVWIEPFIPRDDLWHSDARSGSFSPLLAMPFAKSRPLQAWMRLADTPPLIDAQYDPRGDSDAHAQTAITAALVERADVLATLPPLLRAALHFPAYDAAPAEVPGDSPKA
ncbi:GNAT family N-acetyltransferase [Conyzicola sp.]|uniref:GNAT family N-acetyltransferase n=1 Tax=Conyzicola sp. TaxID=1969404 RepID=UPI003989F47F